MAKSYTSIKVVLDNLLDHPMLQDLTFERAINYTVQFMQLVGCPNIFEEKTQIIMISQYKGLLPCDYVQTNQVRLISPKCNQEDSMFRYTTDTFHMSSNKHCSDLTYKIQGGYIFTSIKEGQIEMSYQAIMTDEQGFPMIPDNSSFIRAIEAYIKLKQFTILFDMGKLHGQILENAKQEYAWAVGDCSSEFVRLSLDQAESFYNSWDTLLMRRDEHSRHFINNGYKEHLTFN